MNSNLYTNNNVIEELAKNGFDIDEKALFELYKKLKIEAIFENEEGSEFYDKNIINIIIEELSKENKTQTEVTEEVLNPQNETEIDLIGLEDEKNIEINESQTEQTQEILETVEFEKSVCENPETPEEQNEEKNDKEIENKEFDDLTLLSESLEAQEKFRQYVIGELTKKNVDLTPKNQAQEENSERIIAIIARSMAKKIAKYVSSFCSAEAKNSIKLQEAQKDNEELQERIYALESQNKKLKLLLAESNKNLNSYRPSIFGLYKKVKPKKK